VPRVIVTRGAITGMERCRRFLQKAGQNVTRRAADAISHALSLLETAPQIGRLVAGQDDLRELLIPFGDSGYVALYRFQPSDDVVYILAFRHQREAGY